MKVVKVYGALRKLLGKSRFEFMAETPAQAMHALLVNFPELEQWLINSEKNGVAYRVTIGRQKIYEEDMSAMFMPWSERDVFAITPVLTGAGSTTRIILGAALIAVAIVNPFGAAAIGTLGITAPILVNTVVGAVGGFLLLSGVAEMLSPVPKPPGALEEPTQLESNSFSGIVNTTRQGVPVPIAYGRVFVGSSIISAGLDVDQV